MQACKVGLFFTFPDHSNEGVGVFFTECEVYDLVDWVSASIFRRENHDLFSAMNSESERRLCWGVISLLNRIRPFFSVFAKRRNTKK